MSLTLSFLFIRLIANVRGPHGLAGIMPEPLWLWLVVSLVLLFIGVLASRRVNTVTLASFSETHRPIIRSTSQRAAGDQE